MNIKKKKAFTLAEILITISIVGIVAALTIPMIKKASFEREAVAKAKETYSLFSQAVTQWQSENGCLNDSASCTDIASYTHNIGRVAPGIIKYLKVQEAYFKPTDIVAKSIPFLPEKSYLLDGSHQSHAIYGYLLMDKDQTQYAYASFFLLTNGVVIEMLGAGKYYTIIMDINGIKPPNRMGKDQFAMTLYSDGHKSLNPYKVNTYWGVGRGGGECINGIGANQGCNANDGRSPLAYVLAHNKLPDLKKLGYPANP